MHQHNFFHFSQLKALIDHKEIQVVDIFIILFPSVVDGVLQKRFYRFQVLRHSRVSCLPTSDQNQNCVIFVYLHETGKTNFGKTSQF